MCALFCISAAALSAQQTSDDNAADDEYVFDIDSLFDAEPDEPEHAAPDSPPPAAKEPAPKPTAPVASSLNTKGLSFSTDFNFIGGFFPGWSEAPWYQDDYPTEQTILPGISLGGSFGLNVKVSESFTVRTSFAFSFPTFSIAMDSFYFDYVIKDAVFIRAGQYSYSWGISRDFPFANLLAITPTAAQMGSGSNFTYWDDKSTATDKRTSYYTPVSPNKQYTARVSVPIGIGGLEFVSMVNYDFFDERNNQTELIWIGGKYNLAFKWADINMGILYHGAMPLRSMFSVKTTIADTELYTEGLLSIGESRVVPSPTVVPDGTGKGLPWYFERKRTWDSAKFSASIGAARSFFARKLTLGAEFFYNGEKGLMWTMPGDATRGLEAETIPFIEGVNLAFNLRYAPGWKNVRFILKWLYGVKENTMQLVPGISITPLPNRSVSMAVPLVLGSRDGTYYSHNLDRLNRPFSVTLAVTFSGGYTWDTYK
jgi:hypothetical protein